MAFEFELPDVGEGIHEGEIVNWLVAEGDEVAEDEDIVEVMTDKATVQISSPVAGTIESLVYAEGDVVEVGEVLVVIQPHDAARPDVDAPEEPASSKAGEPEPTREASGEQTVKTRSSKRQDTDGHAPQRTPEGILAPPSVRIEARKRGIDIAAVDGSDPAGRITMDDLEEHATATPSGPGPSQATAPTRAAGGLSGVLPFDVEPPSVDRDDAREVEPVLAPPRSPRSSAARAMRLQPHFTHAVQVEADELVENVQQATREDESLDLETAFVVKAVAGALEAHERCNAWVDEESRDLVVADEVNVAVATPTPEGLELTTVANANERGVRDIARVLASGAETDVEATFTITSFDGHGGLVSTPVLVHPQVAGAAIGGLRDVGVLEEGGVRAGKEVTLAFTFDHRYVDGYDGALLAEEVQQRLSNPESMLLE